MRVALAPEIDRAAIDALALAQGWRLASIFARPRRVVFVSATSTELITWREEERCLDIDGHDPEALAEAVRGALGGPRSSGAIPPEEGVENRAGASAPSPARGRGLGGGRVEGSRFPEPPHPDPPTRAGEGALQGAWFSARSREPTGSAGAGRGEPSSDALLPERPRLRESVQARMHVADGSSKVILTDPETASVLEIDLASWRALEAADGTRDLDALCLALAREGLYRGEADLAQLLSELSAAGVLADGLPVPLPPPPVAPEETPLDRPLEVLPGFTLSCDGSGSCCRFYGSVAFGAAEAARAHGVAEEARLPIAPRDLFTPAQGAQLDEDGVRTVAQVDGRCAFLEDDGLCLLHRRGGAEAKPFPCRFYPAMLMDDGESVRVSLGPECACVFASAGRSDGAPLVDPSARTLGELGPSVAVMHVPDPVPLTGQRTASRAELARWSRALVARLAETDADALALAWTLAGSLASGGLAIEALERALSQHAAPSASSIAPWARALAEHAERAASTAESWRGGSDLSRRVARWIADALRVADPTALIASAADAASERFYLRALAHGHRLAIEGRPLEHGLRDRATRIFAARAMSAIAPPTDESARYPLALLEAAMRNLGLVRYGDSVSAL